MLLDQINIGVARAARTGKVDGVHVGAAIRGRINVVCPMAVRTSGNVWIRPYTQPAMSLINLSLLLMAFTTFYEFDRLPMRAGQLRRQSFHRDKRMAIDALKVTMHRIGQRFKGGAVPLTIAVTIVAAGAASGSQRRWLAGFRGLLQ
jgi:hypothetical protein